MDDHDISLPYLRDKKKEPPLGYNQLIFTVSYNFLLLYPRCYTNWLNPENRDTVYNFEYKTPRV